MTQDTDKRAEAAGDEALVHELRQQLDASCDRLDGASLSRLNSIRHQALESSPRRRGVLLLPFGGLVTACMLVLAVSVSLRQETVSESDTPALPLEDIEILSTADSLDFYEDYEFYQWLAENGASV